MGDYNRIKRHGERGLYDRETLNSILDEGLISHVAFMDKGRVYNIPMIFSREGDYIILHSSIKSRFYDVISDGNEICITVTHSDAIVVAKSAFHSSMNYRSAMIFGKAEKITGNEDKMSAARSITEKMIKGRWNDCRKPEETELKSTGFLRLKISNFSCKVREGGPVDDPRDLDLPYWSGVIPLNLIAGLPEVSDMDNGKIDLPEYISKVRDQKQ